MFWSSQCRSQEICFSSISPSSRLSLAKKLLAGDKGDEGDGSDEKRGASFLPQRFRRIDGCGAEGGDEGRNQSQEKQQRCDCA